MIRAFQTLSVALILIATSGCQATPHAWENLPDHPASHEWQVIADDHVGVIDAYKSKVMYDKAVALLGTQNVVELVGSQLTELWAARVHLMNSETAPPTDGTRAFLVRSVNYGSSYWARVWKDSQENAVWIHQGSWNGEMAFIPHTEQASPVILFLPAPPANVYATALLSGDGIFNGPPKMPPSTQKP